MKSRWTGVLLVAAVVLGLCEGAARWALPLVPDGLTVYRNPYRFRGWPEFIRGVERGPAGGTLVLISNSQAYAGELPSNRIYPAVLERLLNERRVGNRTDWQVLNWSSDGMTCIEYVLLARYLQVHPPTLVLAVTGFADYSIEHADKGFLHCRTDLPRLVSRSRIVAGLPATYLKRHARVEDCLALALYDRVALYRFKEYLWSWLDVRLPGIHEMFYAPLINYRPWNLSGKPLLPAMELPRGRAPDVQFTYDQRSASLLAEYLDGLSRVPAPVILVAQPRRSLADDPRAQWDAAFIADLQTQARDRNMPLWDLRAALPDKDYLTSSHLLPPNHKRLAELLCDRLQAQWAQTSGEEARTGNPPP